MESQRDRERGRERGERAGERESNTHQSDTQMYRMMCNPSPSFFTNWQTIL